MTEHENEERVFREALQGLADGADVSAPIAAQARAAAARRRAGRVVMAVAAASVAAVSVAGFVVSRDWSDESAGPVVDQPSESAEVTEWRTEYYLTMQVDVPADWGWGEIGFGTNCATAATAPPGVPLDPETTPYVGRPVYGAGECDWPPGPPSADYLWINSDQPERVVDFGNGYVEETVSIGGARFTVASDDAELRRRILESAREGQLCPAHHRPLPTGRSETTDEGVGDLLEARVCAYRVFGDGVGYELMAGAPLDLSDYERMSTEVEQSAPHPEQCEDVQEMVVVTGWYADPYSEDRELWLRHDRVFDLSCRVVDLGVDPLTGERERVEATQEAIDAWASGLFRATLQYTLGPVG